jgi:lactate permease
MGAGMGAAQYALATHGLWNIAGFGGGMVGLALGVVVSRRYRGSAPAQGQGSLNGGRLAVALSAYGALIAITLLIQLVPSVRSALDRYALEVWFPALRTAQGYETPAGLGRRIAFLRHAGFILGYASFAAYWIYRRAGRYRRGAPARIVQGTLQRVLPSSLGIASMVAMAVVMAHAGMTDTLARGLAKAVGSAFPVASPWIGALGAFITGSNTNSNVVFTLLQLRTAVLLGYPQVWILAAQTAGGSVGSIIAPTKVVVGASTGGLAGQEGKVIRALAAPIGLLLAGMSALAWIFSGGLAR